MGDTLWALDSKERLWERRDVTADNIQGRSIVKCLMKISVQMEMRFI